MEKEKRITRILVEYPKFTASVQMGVLRPLRFLEEEGKCALRCRETKEIRRRDVVWCDVVLCVRSCEYPTLQMVRTAKMAGRFLIYFLDDDLLDIPQGNASTRYFNDAQVRENLVGILSQCDVLWTVNRRIQEKYGRWCGRSLLAKVPAQRQRGVPRISEKIHVLYAGSIDHNALVRQKLTYAVKSLLEEYPEKVDFTFIGADLQLPRQPGMAQYPFFESYEQYRKTIREGDFSVGLAPALRSPFYQSKYYNKFIEYTENGLVGIYEDCEPYTVVVKDGENGFLCGERPEDWYEKLREVIGDKEKLQRAANQAAEMLEREFSPVQVSREISKGIPELASFRSRQVSSRELSLPWMWGLFYWERTRLIGRMYGFRAVFIVPWRAARVVWKTIMKRWRGA